MPRQLPLEAIVPGLQQTRWEERSPEDYHYNCIAFAVGEIHSYQWWEPSGYRIHYWPPGIPRDYSLDSYTEVYKLHGYTVCDTEDLEDGYEKVAIFVDSLLIPNHAARQTISGTWVSKIGEYEDIEHDSLRALEGAENYGTVARLLRRPGSNISDASLLNQ